MAKNLNNENREKIESIVEAQRRFFRTDRTLSVEFRIRQLKR